ncbi:MAG: saccharopine dehydrogenase NADP-binding domain-containing protein [Candidatus Krumholzibacteria bacterium]|nr:saccharopine dehydrogenase NADP-binding domain-containing protein [Candidatus Krumholzibacteria bacterium]
MEYLLLGAGLQGTAIAFDLLHHAPGTEKLVVVDSDQIGLTALAERLDDDRVITACADVRDAATLAPFMKTADVTISAVNYWFNATLAALAVEGRSHFLDLGGNNDIVAQEFELDEEATTKGVTVIPDCGLAPGLAGILGYWLVDGLERAESLKLRVGGLPADPVPPMNYKVVFSVQGLINEYIEPAVVIRDGRLHTVPSLTELETLVFPEPFGELEAFQTSGGTSTLPKTLAGRVPNLDYKTIRYKGHCAQFRLLTELGLCESAPRKFRDGEVSPREVLATLLQEKLDLPGQDVVLLLAEAEGWDSEGTAIRKTVRIIDHHDGTNNISAMMRMTGYPAAIIAWMLASGEIKAPGARCQELVVPGDRMIEELRRRGVAIEILTDKPGVPS